MYTGALSQTTIATNPPLSHLTEFQLPALERAGRCVDANLAHNPVVEWECSETSHEVQKSMKTQEADYAVL